MNQVLFLESFDSGNLPPQAAHPEYLRGVTDGRKDAANAVETQIAEKLQQLSDVLDAASFTFAEARQDALKDLSAVIDVAVDEFLPAVAGIGLAGQLKELVREGLESDEVGRMIVTVSPDFASLLDHFGDRIQLRIDDDFQNDTAWIGTQDHEISYSLQRPLAAAKTALKYLSVETQRNVANG